MSRVECFITENFVNREIFYWFESSFLVCQFVKHSCTDCSCVSSLNIFLGFTNFPIVSIANRTISSFFMSFSHTFKIFCWEFRADFRISDEESVLSVTGWMLLRLEQSVKVPERRLNEIVRRHFLKSHL